MEEGFLNWKVYESIAACLNSSGHKSFMINDQEAFAKKTHLTSIY